MIWALCGRRVEMVDTGEKMDSTSKCHYFVKYSIGLMQKKEKRESTQRMALSVQVHHSSKRT